MTKMPIMTDVKMGCETNRHPSIFYDPKIRLFLMPELLENLAIQNPESELRKERKIVTPSLMITGNDRKGKPSAIIIHNRDTINYAIGNLRYGSGEVAQEVELLSRGELSEDIYGSIKIEEDKFFNLVDAARRDKKSREEDLFSIDYEALLAAPRNKNRIEPSIPLYQAMSHPLTIPFCGGEKIAEQYLKMLENGKKDFTKRITFEYQTEIDSVPRARFLAIGSEILPCLNAKTYMSFDKKGDFGYTNIGPFVGVPNAPSRKMIERAIAEYVAPHNQSDISRILFDLYN